MPTDLDIIKQLEQRIGKKLEKLDYISFDSVGYVQNEHDQITGLSLYKCYLNELPLEIGELQNLRLLDLRDNQLSNLPLEIGQLQNLTRLSLENNQLSQFPKPLLELNLEIKWDGNWDEDGIHVKDNPFQTPPVEIVKQGRQAIIDYYAALEEEPDQLLN